MQSQNKQVRIQHLGRIAYPAAWDQQEKLFRETIAIKRARRGPTPNHLLFCEHWPVYTMGTSGVAAHLLVQEQALKEQGVEFYHTNRGGDVTYHGPGQLVAYPILDLENFFTDLHRYLRMLEEAVMATLADFGLQAGRIAGLTGVWLGERKICAIGVRASRWVTMHGLALNVNPELKYFDQIIPCGVSDKKVTSMEAELGNFQDLPAVTDRLQHHLGEVFGMQPVQNA